MAQAVIFTGPLLVYGLSTGGVSLRFSRLLILAGLPLLTARIFTKPALFLRDRFVVYGLLPYLAYTSMSVIWAQDVDVSVSVLRLAGLYEIVVVYLLLVGADLDAEKCRRFVHVYIASAVLPMFVSIWQFANNLFQFSVVEVPFARFLIAGKYTELEGRYFVSAESFSRVSATFAEPVIFSSFLCSVLLLSLLLHPRGFTAKAMLRIFQLTALIIMVLAISKLSLLALALGLAVILPKQSRGALPLLAISVGVFGAILGVLSYFNVLTIFDRLLSDSGHVEFLIETLKRMRHTDLLLGQGIGSVPLGSFHRFILSRVYESGVIGFIFVAFVSMFPVWLLTLRTDAPPAEELRNVALGVVVAVVFGLHAYDYFIHLWPWTALGLMMSFHNHAAARRRAVRRRFGSVAPALA